MKAMPKLAIMLGTFLVLSAPFYCAKTSPAPTPTAAPASTPTRETVVPHRPGEAFEKMGSDGVIRRGYYRISVVFPKKWNYSAWEYKKDSEDGSIRFRDLNTNRITTLTPPYTVEEHYAGKGW